MTEPAVAEVSVDFDEDARWLVLTRGPLTVAANMGPAPAIVPVPGGAVALSSAGDVAVEGGRAQLPPESAIVLKGP